MRALHSLILTFIRINTKHNVIARHSTVLDVYDCDYAMVAWDVKWKLFHEQRALRRQSRDPRNPSLRTSLVFLTTHWTLNYFPNGKTSSLVYISLCAKRKGERERERKIGKQREGAKTRKRTIVSRERETRKRVTSIERHTETARRYARIDNITYRAFGCLLIYRADQRTRVVAIVWKADRKLLLSATTRTAHRLYGTCFYCR